MYTQCPECQTAFRVTVEVLQKAGGRVRCGGCEHAFSALDYLSDGVPGTASNPSSSSNDDTVIEESEDFDAKSKSLLETLDELAGTADVRIEDTGVEWRVLDENGTADDAAGTQTSLEISQHSERRYDDNTQLPDDFADEEDMPYVPDAPQRRVTDDDEQQTDIDTHQVDMALEHDETWAELLDSEDDEEEFEAEVVAEDSNDDLAQQLEAAEARQIADDSALLPQLAASLADSLQREDGSADANLPFDVEEELAAIHNELTAVGASSEADESVPDDLDAQFNMQAEALGLDITRDEKLEAPEVEDEPDDAAVEIDANEELPFDESSDDTDEDDDATSITEVDDDLDEQEDEVSFGESDEDFVDDDEDELSAEEEADIVQKLRDSTGSFQKQIEAAKQALDRGDVEQNLEEDESDQDDAHEDDSLQLEDDEDEVAETELDDNDIRSQLTETYSDIDPQDLPAPNDDDTSEQDALEQTMIQAGIDPSALDSGNVETIIMEGDFIRGTLDDKADETIENEAVAGLDDQKSLVDTYMLNKGKVRGGRRRTDPASYGMMAGIVVLTILLAAQYLHASRQTFATYGAFNQTVGPVYRALGSPVTPQWNIKGWQFEHTNGSTDDNDEVLTVFSTVRNTSEEPLPYPLVHVSLTDRWEDIIGSKILEPGDYLAGDMDPRTPVAPGESFTAVIVIERPSTEATGFQLYVCYRVGAGKVRCATEDFKE